jgi:hypothetical protein
MNPTSFHSRLDRMRRCNPRRMRARADSLPRRSRRRGSDEQGFATATVLLMMLAAFAVVTVGVTASINAQRGTVRDESTKSALGVAEAGVAQALLNYNGGFSPADTSPCLTPVGNPANTVQPRVTQGDGWCAPVSGTSGSGSFTYQVCPRWSESTQTCLTSGAATGSLNIVSNGAANGVGRRVDVIAKSAGGSQIFLDAGVKSQTDITLDSNAEIHSPSSAGGNIALSSSSTKLCGLATVGPSGSATGSGLYTSDSDCLPPALSLSTVGHQSVTLPPVNQGDAATVNDNCRIRAATTGVASCSGGDFRDLISGSVNNVSWNPATRALDLSGQKTSLTLTGKTYSFCRLTMSQNSSLYVAATNPKVTIFFDSPEHCGLPAYNPATGTLQKATAQMYLESNTRITAATGQALGLYFVGSPTIRTGVLMSSNSDGNASCVQNFVIYAPLTEIELNSNSTYCGAIAGKSIHMDSNARFLTNNNARSIVLPGGAPHYVKSKFVDCAAASSSSPIAGC